MTSEDNFTPIALTIPRTQQVTGESRSKIYERIARGDYIAVKSDGRTLVLYDSIQRYFAQLPRANIKAPAGAK
jgi:hypothetical protein